MNKAPKHAAGLMRRKSTESFKFVTARISQPGSLVRVKVESADDYDLFASLADGILARSWSESASLFFATRKLLRTGQVLLINPPRDSCFSSLSRDKRQVSVFSQDFGDYNYLKFQWRKGGVRTDSISGINMHRILCSYCPGNGSAWK